MEQQEKRDRPEVPAKQAKQARPVKQDRLGKPDRYVQDRRGQLVRQDLLDHW